MRLGRVVVSCAMVLVPGLLSAGCGEGSKEVPPAVGDGGDVPDMPFETGGPGSCGNTAKPVNADICEGMEPTSCAAAQDKPIESCGVLLPKPAKAQPDELVRTTDTTEYSGTGKVDISCFEPAGYPTAGTSKTVTMEGRVKIFAAGCDAKDVKVEVYKVLPTGPVSDTVPGELLGQAVVTSETSPAENDEFEGDCSDARVLRRFTYPGVPTETELIIKSSDATGSGGWSTLYDYNVYISNDDVVGDVWDHDVRALAADDFSTIPSAAMGRTITSGNGGVAGEIHDCGDIRVSYAFVEVDRPRASLVYLSENEEDPMPDMSRGSIGTGKLGLYAALDIQPGPIILSAVGVLDGELVTLGYAKAYIHKNSVSLVTLRGPRPYQIP